MVDKSRTYAGALPPPTARPALAPYSSPKNELHRQILWLIAGRALVVFLGLNLADAIEILPLRIGLFPFASFLNTLTITLTGVYLFLWKYRWNLRFQIYLQSGGDLILTTLLVASTRGIESPFVSYYLLIIIYSSLTLGRNGAIISSAFSAIVYSGLITGSQLGIIRMGPPRIETEAVTFRLSLHTLGFLSVAFLGTYLSVRLHAVQEELEEKIDSVRELRRLNERIVSSIRSGLITTDLAGRITVFNNAAEEITEKRSTELREGPVQSIIGDELWSRIQGADLRKDLRPLRHESWLNMPVGSKRYLGFSVSPLMDQGGESMGYIISFQDLTEIKRLEEEILLREKMAAIGRMAAGIAHEIRNPLTSIRGSAEVLRSRLTLEDRDARLMDIMLRESDRLNKFVEDFLSFARPGKHPRQPVELVSLLKETSTLFENNPSAQNKHSVVLNLETPQAVVRANPDQLKQVFWNLWQNAIRAMPDGGTLTIKVRKVDDGGAQVIFQDTGVGMTQEEKENLFQPFHSGFSGGTGLGLSIVFQIVDDHKGKISYESEKGHGTMVTVYLPADASSAKTAYVQ